MSADDQDLSQIGPAIDSAPDNVRSLPGRMTTPAQVLREVARQVPAESDGLIVAWWEADGRISFRWQGDPRLVHALAHTLGVSMALGIEGEEVDDDG